MSTFLMRGHWGQLSGLHLDVVHNCCCLQWHWPWQCWHKASYVSGDEEVESTCRPMKAWLKKENKFYFDSFHITFLEFTLGLYLSYRAIMSRLHCIKNVNECNVTHFGAKNYKDNLAWQKSSLYKSKIYVLNLLILLTSKLSGNFVWIMKFFEAFLITLS